MRTKWWLALLFGCSTVACCSCATHETSATPNEDSRPAVGMVRGTVYSRFNLHYYVRGGVNLSPRLGPVARRAAREVSIASCLNFTDCPRHTFLPHNTPIRVGRWGSGFRVVPVDTPMTVYVEYNSPDMQWMPVEEYTRLITAPGPVAYEGLNAQDQEGIKLGKAMVGMTKQGVMVALGYPAKGRTPSTDLNTWLYWKDRVKTLQVDFGSDGIVQSLK